MELPGLTEIKPYDAFYEAQKILAQQHQSNDWFAEWLQRNEGITPFVELQRMNISKGIFLLGHSSLTYTKDNTVTYPISITKEESGAYRSDPVRMLVVGAPGSGKSGHAAVLGLDNLTYRFNCPTLVFDPGPTAEWYMHKQPITDVMSGRYPEQVTEFLATMNLKPQGYKGVVYQPRYNSSIETSGVDKDFKLTLEDLRKIYLISKEEGKSALLDIVGMSDERLADSTAGRILRNDKLKTFSDAITYLKPKKEKEEKAEKEKENADDDQETMRVSYAFRRYLEDNLLEGAISDYPAPGQNLLRDLQDYSFVVWRNRTTARQTETITTLKSKVLTNAILTSVLEDRRKYIDAKSEEVRASSFLKGIAGPLLIADEFHQLVPAGKTYNYTRDLFLNTALQERKIGLSVIGVTQYLDKIHPDFVKSVHYIITFRIEEDKKSETNVAQALRDRNVPEHIIDIGKDLPYQKYNNFGQKMSKAMLINMNTFEYKTYWPETSLSAIKIT